MTKKQIIAIFAMCILMALFIPAVSAADPCSFCEFINISNITKGVTDHSLLTNLSADDHHQYILTDGTRPFTGKQSLGGFNLTDLLDPVAAQDAATKNYVDTVNASMRAYVDLNPPISDHGLLSNLSGDGHPQYLRVDGTRAMSGNLTMGTNQIISLVTGKTGDTATNKTYVDAVNSSLKAYVDTGLPYISSNNSSIVLTSNSSYVLVDGSRPFSGDQSMGSHQLTNLITGTLGTTATNKTYVDAVNSSMRTYVDSVVSADAAPGSNGQVIYNQGGAEGANASFTFNNTTGTVTAPYFVGDGSGLTGIGATAATALTFEAKEANVGPLYKGQAVYISGGNQGRTLIKAADNSNAASSRVVGLVVADMNQNANGYVRRAGVLTDVDSRAGSHVNPNNETWLAGDLLFATTGGGLTKVRPTSGRSVKVAYSLEGSNIKDNLLAYPMENPVWITAASAENVVLRLGDSAGANKTSFRNYGNSEVAYVDSYGRGSFNGTTMNAKNISAVLDPVGAQDAATKNYVDTRDAKIGVARLDTSITTASTTATNMTGLSFYLGAGQTIQFDGYINNGNSAADGNKYAIYIPAGATLVCHWEGDTNVPTARTMSRSTASETLTTEIYHNVANQNGYTTIHGTIKGGATAGTVTLMYASANAANTVTINAGSYLEWKKLDSATAY